MLVKEVHTMTAAFFSGRTKAFISYSHKDKRHLERLQIQLAHLVRTEAIDLWDDTKITPGSNWYDEIMQAISLAKVAVLLVSADFLASEFIARYELPSLLAAARDDGAVILPVILGPCLFHYTVLAQFQSVNNPTRPLNKMPIPNRDDIWVEVAERVKKTLDPQELDNSTRKTKPTNAEITAPLSTRKDKINIEQPTSPPTNSNGTSVSSTKSKSSPIPEPPPLKSKEEYLATGYSALWKGLQEEALSAFDTAIKLDSEFAPAYFGRGDVLMNLGRLQEALSDLEKTLKLEPRVAAAYRRKGFILNQLGKYKGALDALEKAIRLDSDHALTYVGKGDALKEIGRYEEALSSYEEAIQRDSKLAEAYVGIGDVHIQRGEYVTALDAYEMALLKEPQNEDAADGKNLVVQLRSRSGRVTKYRSQYGPRHSDASKPDSLGQQLSPQSIPPPFSNPYGSYDPYNLPGGYPPPPAPQYPQVPFSYPFGGTSYSPQPGFPYSPQLVVQQRTRALAALVGGIVALLLDGAGLFFTIGLGTYRTLAITLATIGLILALPVIWLAYQSRGSVAARSWIGRHGRTLNLALGGIDVIVGVLDVILFFVRR
jgi:Flp pilus assembly protein TadD